MKIIRTGSLPENRVYRATCHKCDTEIEFERREAVYHTDHRDGDYLAIPCPICPNMLTKAVN